MYLGFSSIPNIVLVFNWMPPLFFFFLFAVSIDYMDQIIKGSMLNWPKNVENVSGLVKRAYFLKEKKSTRQPIATSRNLMRKNKIHKCVYCSIPEVAIEKVHLHFSTAISNCYKATDTVEKFFYRPRKWFRTSVKNVNDSHAGSRIQYGCFMISNIFPFAKQNHISIDSLLNSANRRTPPQRFISLNFLQERERERARKKWRVSLHIWVACTMVMLSLRASSENSSLAWYGH